jgi:hypothetical protein
MKRVVRPQVLTPFVLGVGLIAALLALGDIHAVYFLSLAVGLLFPVPVDFGVMEASGTGGFLAYAVQEFAAVSAMLLNRVLSPASSLVIALTGVIFLHDELRRALQERPRRRPVRTPQAPRKPNQVAYSGAGHNGRDHAELARGRRQQLARMLYAPALSGERKRAVAGRRQTRATLRSQYVAVVRFTIGVSYERPSARS